MVMMYACGLLVQTKTWSVVFGMSSIVCTDSSLVTGTPGITPGLQHTRMIRTS